MESSSGYPARPHADFIIFRICVILFVEILRAQLLDLFHKFRHLLLIIISNAFDFIQFSICFGDMSLHALVLFFEGLVFFLEFIGCS